MAKNILICDDAAFMRMMIKDILTKNGYNVAGEAENGMKAVEKFKEVNPDLVLMDITMPETVVLRLSCVLQWASRQWLSSLSRPVPKISL